MASSPRLRRLDERILRSKRAGKLVLGGVVLTSLLFGSVLIQAMMLALDSGRSDVMPGVVGGLALLVAVDLLAAVLVRRQHRLLDEVREDLETLVMGDPLD